MDTRPDLAAAATPQLILVQLIDPDPFQSRLRDDPLALGELTANIAARGLLEPIRVRPSREDPERYWVYAGGRRTKAFAALAAEDPERWRWIPAYIDAEKTDDAALTDSLSENLHRADLTAVEKGRAMLRLLELRGWDVEQLAAHLDRHHDHIGSLVAKTRLVLNSPELLQADAEKPYPARLLRSLPKEPEVQRQFVRVWREWDGSDVRPLIGRIRQWENGESVEIPGEAGATRMEHIRRCIRELRMLREPELWELGARSDAEQTGLATLVSEARRTISWLESAGEQPGD